MIGSRRPTAPRVLPLAVDLLDRSPEHVRRCLTWQRVAGAGGPAESSANAAMAKRDWLGDVTAAWGPPGRAVVIDEEVVAVLVYAPAAHLAGVGALPSTPVGADAVVMTCPYVVGEHRGTGLGRQLVRAMARDLLDRYGTVGPVRAVETVATHPHAPVAGCLPPVGFCLETGFVERRAHPTMPRMRLDLRRCLSWRDEVEAAARRLRDGVRRPRAAPAPGTARLGPTGRNGVRTHVGPGSVSRGPRL